MIGDAGIPVSGEARAPHDKLYNAWNKSNECRKKQQGERFIEILQSVFMADIFSSAAGAGCCKRTGHLIGLARCMYNSLRCQQDACSQIYVLRPMSL